MPHTGVVFKRLGLRNCWAVAILNPLEHTPTRSASKDPLIAGQSFLEETSNYSVSKTDSREESLPYKNHD